MAVVSLLAGAFSGGKHICSKKGSMWWAGERFLRDRTSKKKEREELDLFLLSEVKVFPPDLWSFCGKKWRGELPVSTPAPFPQNGVVEGTCYTAAFLSKRATLLEIGRSGTSSCEGVLRQEGTN